MEMRSTHARRDLLGLECAALILANPTRWSSALEWLLTLPMCVKLSYTDRRSQIPRNAFYVKEDRGGITEYTYVDEKKHQQVFGPIARRLIQGCRVLQHRETFRCEYAHVAATANFGREEARRITLLAAFLYNRDFDGTGLPPVKRLDGVPEFPWRWEGPLGAPQTFEGRDTVIGMFGVSNEIVQRSLDYLRQLPLALQGESDDFESSSATTPTATMPELKIGKLASTTVNNIMQSVQASVRAAAAAPVSGLSDLAPINSFPPPTHAIKPWRPIDLVGRPDAMTIDAIQRFIKSWDGEDWDPVYIILEAKLSSMRIKTMTEKEVRQFFVIRQKELSAMIGGQAFTATNSIVTMENPLYDDDMSKSSTPALVAPTKKPSELLVAKRAPTSPTRVAGRGYAATNWFRMNKRTLETCIREGSIAAQMLTQYKWVFDLDEVEHHSGPAARTDADPATHHPKKLPSKQAKARRSK